MVCFKWKILCGYSPPFSWWRLRKLMKVWTFLERHLTEYVNRKYVINAGTIIVNVYFSTNKVHLIFYFNHTLVFPILTNLHKPTHTPTHTHTYTHTHTHTHTPICPPFTPINSLMKPTVYPHHTQPTPLNLKPFDWSICIEPHMRLDGPYMTNQPWIDPTKFTIGHSYFKKQSNSCKVLVPNFPR